MVSLNLKNMSLETEIDFKGEIIPISIGENNFEIVVSEREVDDEYNKYTVVSDKQFEVLTGIVAIEKLLKYLKISLDINISDEMIG